MFSRCFSIYSGIPISRTLGFPNLPISRTKPCWLGLASLKLYNFTPDFSNPRFLETPDNSNQFWLPWDKLTLDNSNLQKFRNHLARTSITFTPLNKLTLPDKLFSRILITQQATNPSVISLKGTMTVFCSVLFLFFKNSTFCLWIKVKIYIKKDVFLLKFEHLDPVYVEWGPRSSVVSLFCFVFPRAWKQRKLTPLDRGPPLHVNRPLLTFTRYPAN